MYAYCSVSEPKSLGHILFTLDLFLHIEYNSLNSNSESSVGSTTAITSVSN